MANDVNANIRININSAEALGSLRALQNQISAFNRSVIQTNAAAAASQRDLLTTLTAQIGATGQFTTSIANVESSVSRLGRAIDKNKLSLGEYFRFGVASSKRFGRVFGREQAQITALATERVKRLQTQYIALGEAQNGMTKAMAVRPMNLFNADAAIAIQRQQLFNKLLRDGSTSLVNFGKNTQWAGRQLMVGFTVPLTIFGGVAGQIFMDLERQIVNFRRVYGDATTPAVETEGMIDQIKILAQEFTKYGIAVKDTITLAADAAAAGAQGTDLLAATEQATRLATLGMMDQQQALTATIALQSAFRLSAEELAESVNFLNAVENQTVVSLQDITEAIPKVAPVIQGLGGDVQDLAIFMAAMREGGVSAGEGANALKSGLASLINPTKNAREQLQAVNIDIDAILSKNKGDLRAIVTEFGTALQGLSRFQRQQTLAKVFGKYQFARLGALFENIGRQGSQAQRVIDLTTDSLDELGQLAEKELGAISDSVGVKFTGAVERLKLAIAPLGEAFLRVATPIVEFATRLAEKFDELSPTAKNVAVILVTGLGVVIPTLTMLIGLFANFVGQAIKGVAIFGNFFSRMRNGGAALDYLASEQLDATASAASLEGRTETLTTALNVQRSAVLNLARAYQTYVGAASGAAAGLPRGFRGPVRRMAAGGLVGGKGNKDSEPALLMPGEFVMNKGATEKFGPILNAMNKGSIAGYAKGSRDQFAHIGFGQSVELGLIRKLMDELPDSFSEGAKRFVRILADQFGDTLKGILLPSLGFMTSGDINRRLAKPGSRPVGQGEFLEDWDKRGLSRWKESLRRSGLKFDDVAEELTMLDAAMRTRITSLGENARIDDRVMKQIYDESIKTIPAQSRLRREFDLLSGTYKEVRVNLRKSMLAAQGIPITQVGSKQMASVQGRSFKVGGDKAQFTKIGTGVSSEQIAAARTSGATLGASLDDGARSAIGAASPARDGMNLVDDYVDGMMVGAKQNMGQARQSGAMINGAFSAGAAPGGIPGVGPAFMAQAGMAGMMLSQQPGGPRSDINTRELIPGEIGGAGGGGGGGISAAGAAADGAGDSFDKAGEKAAKFNSRLIGLSMGATSVAAGMSMMDNEAGNTAAKLLPLLAIVDALAIGFSLFGGNLGKAGGKIKGFGTSMKGAASGFMAFLGKIPFVGKFISILGKLQGLIGKVVSAFMRFSGLRALLGVFARIAAFLGPQGIIAGVIALGAVLVGVYKQSEDFRNGIAAIGTALKELFESIFGPADQLGNKMNTIGNVVTTVWNKIVDVVTPVAIIIAKVIEIVVKALTVAITFFKEFVRILIEGIPQAADTILDKLGPVGDWLRNLGSSIADTFRAIPGAISSVWDSLIEIVVNAVNFIIDKLNFLIRAAQKLGADISEISLINLGGPDGGAQRASARQRQAEKRAQERMASYAARDAAMARNLKDRGQAEPEDIPLDEELTGSGSEKEKTFLENLIDDLAANSVLYVNAEKGLLGYEKNRGKFFGVFQKLRRKGVSEDIIAALGTGPEAIKNARELLNMGKKELQKLMKDMETVSVGQVIENARRQAIADEQKLRAQKKIGGLSPEMQEIIMSDEAMVKAFATTKKGTPEYDKLLKVVQRLAAAKRNLADASKTEADRQNEAIAAIDEARQPVLAEFERREALFQQAFGQLDRQWAPILAANERQIDLLQGQIDEVQGQIDALEELNEADERRIRGLERQKEMLQRQIDDLDRQNELDRRRIDNLNREDELRNRVAEALEKELQDLSLQEEAIRKAYDDRFRALDKIATVNDYIINQQNKQISLSRALAEGDIYAAAQAAQEMRAESAAFSQQQARAGMETAMENEVSGLRTGGGLTREEAEEKIRQIQEQSYQTSLLIREIEDAIYQRNLEMIPLKDQQFNLDKQIQGIQDIIYDRETKIMEIQVTRLDPLNKQLEAQQKSLTNNQKALADAKAAVRVEGQTYDELQNQISAEKEAYDVAVSQIKVGGDIRNSVENIRKKWVDVTKQIAAAVRTAKQLKEEAELASQSTFAEIDVNAAAGRITPDTAEQKKAAARAARDAAFAAIDQARNAEISAALGSGTEALRMAAGGVVKKMKGYRGGGVVSGIQARAKGGFVLGDGARDSVPVMLTPGEFVVRKAMVKKYGKSMLSDINLGSFSMPRYNTGRATTAKINNNAVSASINAPVYNTYDMNFTINGTNLGADEIANQVMVRLQRSKDTMIRSNRV